MTDTIVEIEELWETIPEFRKYRISSLGRIYNEKQRAFMAISYNNYGHAKITLTDDWSGLRYTRSVALLVAEAFVEPPSILCDHLVVLDGDFSNVAAYNLAWRPRGFAWKYTRQLKTEQPRHYHNLPTYNVTEGILYGSIIEAGMSEGLLFDDIWRSTYTGYPVYPFGSIFEIVQKYK